jgi:hypothetical protein
VAGIADCTPFDRESYGMQLWSDLASFMK